MTLPQLAPIDDYADEATERPIDQYQDKPRFLALILSFVRRCQELENAAWDVILKRMIDNAENAQLDTIGKIVGQLRDGQTDAVYRIYITARTRINRSQGHADDVIDVLMLIEAGIPTWTEYYPASAMIEYPVLPGTDPNILIDLAKLAVAAGVNLVLVTADAATAFLFGDDTVGGQVNAAHGFSDEAGTTGGQLAGIW